MGFRSRSLIHVLLLHFVEAALLLVFYMPACTYTAHQSDYVVLWGCPKGPWMITRGHSAYYMEGSSVWGTGFMTKPSQPPPFQPSIGSARLGHARLLQYDKHTNNTMGLIS